MQNQFRTAVQLLDLCRGHPELLQLLLEHMPNISRNHAYFTAPDAADAVMLASQHARHIARDMLTFHEEIGEGAFGKVYKGTVNPRIVLRLYTRIVVLSFLPRLNSA